MATLAASHLSAKGVFPTVKDLEIAFHLASGMDLGKDIQAADGQVYHSFYEGSKDLGNGYYSVTIKLGK